MGRSWKSADIAAFITALASKLKPDTRSILDLGVGDGELARCLGHAPGLRHREQNVQVAQLDPAPDPVVPAHVSSP